MSAHTPGRGYVCDKRNAPVYLCPLHAAAPALLEALEEIVERSDRGDWLVPLNQARAAIALARGGENGTPNTR